MRTLDLQTRLKALGEDPGPFDGQMGPKTRSAVRAFQADHGLVVDGLVGPKTLEAINKAMALKPTVTSGRAPVSAVTPPWYAEARRHLGLHELAGRGSTPLILKWGHAIASWYVDDDTPWCGAFVHGQLAATLPEEPLPANALWARSWATFGRALSRPALGAVLVFERGPSSGHVGFYAGEDATRFRVLGGNQSNAVTEAWVAKSRLLAVRWPLTFALPTGGAVLVSAGGALSTNEA